MNHTALTDTLGTVQWHALVHEAVREHRRLATMRRAIQAWKLRHVFGGKAIRLRPEWIDAWLEATSVSIEDAR